MQEMEETVLNSVQTKGKLLVKNLSIRCQEIDLWNALESDEGLEQIEMRYDVKLTGFAILTFANVECAERALATIFHRQIHGRKLM